MLPLTQQLCDKGILLTAKRLAFQRCDGWTWNLSLSLPHQLLQTDPNSDFGKFTAERMPPSFVTHVQGIVNGAP